MLKIAVCDDQSTELKRLSELANEYITEKNIEAQVSEFIHPEGLLCTLEKEGFHIFLLDMVMPMVSGLELGREIRRISTDTQIIYISTEPCFALDAYAVNPLHYLLKPVDKAALFSALDLAAEKIDYGEEATVTVKAKDGLHILSTNNIICCEYIRHAVIYTLANDKSVETTTLPSSFADHIAPLLRNKRFIHPHASYVVNMSMVERLDKGGFTLKGGAFVPVSGRQYVAVRNAYMSYRLGEV